MRYALIGCGRIAPRHLAAARGAGLEICALCDIQPERARAFCAPGAPGEGAAVYSDFARMLERERPELTAVATPSGLHAAIARRVLLAGSHLILEKPVAMSAPEGEALAALAARQGLVGVACHQNRLNPAVRWLRQLAGQGVLGQIYYGAAAVRWQRRADYYAQAPWRGRWESDGGVLMNQCIHAVDLLCWLLGRPVAVTAAIANLGHPTIEAEDWGAAAIEFAGGARATLEGTSLAQPANLEETLTLFGSEGAARVGGVSLNRPLFCKTRQGELPLPAGEADGSVYGAGHGGLYADTVEAIRQGRPPLVPLEAGALAARVVLAIYQSARLGRRVALEEAAEPCQMRGFLTPLGDAKGREEEDGAGA